MDDLLSPKQVAQALKVSESSVKRWCDKGAIATTYTEGGHRRIRLTDLAGFVRSKSLSVIDFKSLGLESSGLLANGFDSARDELTESLLAGDEGKCYQVILNLFLARHPVYQICDDVIAAAFHEIGDRWECGQAEIYQERRGCRIAQRLLNQLLAMIPEPSASSPLAIGCSAEGDSYALGSGMAELVLREAGWRSTALGENLPLSSLGAAIATHQPRMVWVSCSHIDDSARLICDYNRVFETHRSNVAFVLGGRALEQSILDRMSYSVFCRTMADLYAFATRQLATLPEFQALTG